VGINWANGSLPKATWMQDKLKAVIFQNREKMGEWDRDALGFENTERICLYGAIDLEKYLEVKMRKREGKEPLVIVRHGVLSDYRKTITEQSENNGERKWEWQKAIFKERDTKFYERLLGDCKFPLEFHFMDTNPEMYAHFKGDKRFHFYKFDEIPVTEFLAKGHIHLDRYSNLWFPNYPRVLAEALAAGLPCLGEPRGGQMDRIIHGQTGFLCIDFDQFAEVIKKLHRKEDFRFKMGLAARKWAKDNLNPQRWVETINRLLL